MVNLIIGNAEIAEFPLLLHAQQPRIGQQLQMPAGRLRADAGALSQGRGRQGFCAQQGIEHQGTAGVAD